MLRIREGGRTASKWHQWHLWGCVIPSLVVWWLGSSAQHLPLYRTVKGEGFARPVAALDFVRPWKATGRKSPITKEEKTMMSANISNATRKRIYRREGYMCALCGSTKYLQIHHAIPRGEGGTSYDHNLICLCSDCHAMAHGINLRDWVDVTQEDINQAITEYLADFYAPDWNPWREDCHPGRPH